MYALVAIVSVAVGCLIFAALLSRAEQQMLLHALLPKPALDELKLQLGGLALGSMHVVLPGGPGAMSVR